MPPSSRRREAAEAAREEPGENRAPSERPDRPASSPRPREIGGPKGPEPTRYGDWEKGGRCTDF